MKSLQQFLNRPLAIRFEPTRNESLKSHQLFVSEGLNSRFDTLFMIGDDGTLEPITNMRAEHDFHDLVLRVDSNDKHNFKPLEALLQGAKTFQRNSGTITLHAGWMMHAKFQLEEKNVMDASLCCDPKTKKFFIWEIRTVFDEAEAQREYELCRDQQAVGDGPINPIAKAIEKVLGGGRDCVMAE